MTDVPSPLTVQDVKGYNSWPFVQTLGGGLVCAYSRGDRHSIDERSRGVYEELTKTARCCCGCAASAQTGIMICIVLQMA